MAKPKKGSWARIDPSRLGDFELASVKLAENAKVLQEYVSQYVVEVSAHHANIAGGFIEDIQKLCYEAEQSLYTIESAFEDVAASRRKKKFDDLSKRH